MFYYLSETILLETIKLQYNFIYQYLLRLVYIACPGIVGGIVCKYLLGSFKFLLDKKRFLNVNIIKFRGKNSIIFVFFGIFYYGLVVFIGGYLMQEI